MTTCFVSHCPWCVVLSHSTNQAYRVCRPNTLSMLHCQHLTLSIRHCDVPIGSLLSPDNNTNHLRLICDQYLHVLPMFSLVSNKHNVRLFTSTFPLCIRRCCDVESTSMTLIQRRNNVPKRQFTWTQLCSSVVDSSSKETKCVFPFHSQKFNLNFVVEMYHAWSKTAGAQILNHVSCDSPHIGPQ